MRRATKDKNNIYTKLLKDKKGISPVITTVILVAVGIALAVAIGLWMSGLVATFTRFEKLEVTSAYAVSTSGGWSVYVAAKNTGSADATITSLMINGIPTTSISGITGWKVNATVGTTVVTSTDEDPGNKPVSVPVGATLKIQFYLTSNTKIGSGTAISGITLNVVLHSAAGKDYPASVTLP
jgi:flagellin-like protein